MADNLSYRTYNRHGFRGYARDVLAVAYARQAKNRQLEIDAAEIRLRAERRVGQLIVAQKETVGLAQGGSVSV